MNNTQTIFEGTDDAVIEALADERRRCVLYYLQEHEHGTVPFDELADLVTGWTNAGGGVADADDRRRVAIRLHHVDLPMLEETGLVAVDDERRVTLRSLPDDVREPLAELLTGRLSH